MLLSSFAGIYLLLNRDLSNDELGTSPFKVDSSIVEENNAEYIKLIEIGKKIIGEEEYNEKYQPIDFNNPKNGIDLLQEYFQKNQINLDKETMGLFKELKFPKPKLEINHSYYLLNIFRYYQKKVILEILFNNFDIAKKYFIIMDQASEILLNKSTSCASGMVLITSKSLKLSVVKTFINSPNFTIDQKLEILEIQNNPIPSKFLINIMHFEEELFRSNILRLKKENIKTQPFIIFQAYTLQPNYSVKTLRDTMIEKIIMYESPMSTLKDMVEYDKTPYVNIKFYSKNVQGIIVLDMVLPVFLEVARKLQVHKNYCNQLAVAKEILYFKKKTGSLPNTLEELNLPQDIIIDKFTSEKFLYFAENGILQSVWSGINDYISLTEIKLPKDEIRRLLNEEKGDDYILYLE